MARKNHEANGDVNGKPRSAKYPNNNGMYSNSNDSISKSPGKVVAQRLSPSRMPSPSGSPGSSPRMSPGLSAGHYAGCKWSEPPLPSALPRPPQHWMSAVSSITCPFIKETAQQHDVSYHLKVLLNMQA